MSLTYSSKTWIYTPENTDYFYKRPTDLSEGYFEPGEDIPWYAQPIIGDWGEVSYVNGYNPSTHTYTDEEGRSYSFGYWVPDEGNIAINAYNKKLNNESIQANSVNTAKNNFHLQVQNIVNATNQGQYNYLNAKKAIQSQKTILVNAGLSETEANKTIDNMVGSTGQFRNYYNAERVTPFDPAVLPGNLTGALKERSDLGANFNKYADGKSGYYLNETPQGKAALAKWNQAIADDNLDIISRYGSKEAYAKYDYLQQITDPTKNAADIAAIRASQIRPLSPLVTDYREQVFPDAVAQQTRDAVQNKIFGLKPVTAFGQTSYQFRDVQQELSDLVSKNSTFNSLWAEAKQDVAASKLLPTANAGPWTKLTNALGVNSDIVEDPTTFGSLLGRVSILNNEDPNEQKIIADNNKLFQTVSGLTSNATFKELISYTPEINEAFTSSVQASEAEATKKFGTLRQQVLQDTIKQLKIAKQKEANLAFFKASSVGQEISSLQKDISNSLLGDLNVGGVLPGTQFGKQENLQKKVDFGLSDIFGTKNGLLYNWEDWFNTEIEKKYAGAIDIPNDYVPPLLRTKQNGFVDETTINSWKKYDDAYAALKINPNDLFAKSVIASAPSDYVAVDQRKKVQDTWLAYEQQLKSAGYVDANTLATWAKYDDAYQKLQTNPNDVAAQELYAKRPADYVIPEQRMDKSVQFAKDFFSTYLKPRFDASQSIAEFQDYIDVTKNTQNPFQTQDRLDALKLAAQTSVSNWFASLQKAGDSRFNSDYYFNPEQYLREKGVGDPNNPLLPGAAFADYPNTAAGKQALYQSTKVNSDWEAAKKGEDTLDEYGNPVNWAKQAYDYGVDVNNKAAFANLHYQLVGINAPQKDENGNIIKDENGNPVIRSFDAAPDVYAPQIAKLYIKQILTPYLIDKANKIGSVFGEFIKPADYVDEVLKAINLPQNKDQFGKVLENYGIDPNASYNEIKNTLTDALSQDSTAEIKKKIGDLITKGKTPTQAELGVEFIQRGTTASGTVTPASGIYAIFKKAGFQGTESEFYSSYFPDTSPEDLAAINAVYTTSGQVSTLLPTISGTGFERISTMAQLFGDTDIQEVLGTAGITPSTTKPSALAQLLSTSGDVGISDPFADTTQPFFDPFGTTTTSGTAASTENKMGIGNPFDDMGISDPFAEGDDLFSTNADLFGSTTKTKGLGVKLSTPKIGTTSNSFSSFFSSTNDPFSSFGSSFGF